MGMFTNTDQIREVEELEVNLEELEEAYFYDDHYNDSDEEKRYLIESSGILNERSNIGNKTIVRLNKNDDLSRRTSMAALQLSKDANDNLWKKLVKNRIQERKILAQIRKKWGSKAEIVAQKAQREYLKNGGNNHRGSNNVKKMNPHEMAATRSV